MKKFPKNGFTLIELLVVVAILAIIMAYAVPGLTSMSERGQMRANLDKFKTSLQMARSEAVTRRAPVVICGSTNGTACRASGRQQFGDGWIMFLDRDNNTAANLGSGNCADDEDCMLNSERFSSGRLEVISSNNEIGFNPDGTPIRAEGYDVRVCAGNAEENNDTFRSVTITIMPTGSFSVRKGTDSC